MLNKIRRRNTLTEIIIRLVCEVRKGVGPSGCIIIILNNYVFIYL